MRPFLAWSNSLDNTFYKKKKRKQYRVYQTLQERSKTRRFCLLSRAFTSTIMASVSSLMAVQSLSWGLECPLMVRSTLTFLTNALTASTSISMARTCPPSLYIVVYKHFHSLDLASNWLQKHSYGLYKHSHGFYTRTALTRFLTICTSTLTASGSTFTSPGPALSYDPRSTLTAFAKYQYLYKHSHSLKSKHRSKLFFLF